MGTEEAADRGTDDRPELLIKLQERKARHKQRHIFHRIAVVFAGILIVIAGIILTLPGVPGPGIVTIIFGVGFLALEFDRAERWLERVVIWGDRTAERAEQTTPRQRLIAGVLTTLALGAFAAAAILWDIPLVPFL